MTTHRDYIVRRFGPDALPPRAPNPPTSADGFEPIPAFLRRGPAPLPFLPGSVLTATRRRRRRNFRGALFRLWQAACAVGRVASVIIAAVAFYGLCVVTP